MRKMTAEEEEEEEGIGISTLITNFSFPAYQ